MTGRYMGKTFPVQEPWYICRVQPVNRGNPKRPLILRQPNLGNHVNLVTRQEGAFTHTQLQNNVTVLVKAGHAEQGIFSSLTGAQEYTDNYFGGTKDPSSGNDYDASTYVWGVETRDGSPLVKMRQPDGTYMLWIHKKDRRWLPTIGVNRRGHADINEHFTNDPTFGGNTYLQHHSEMLNEMLPGEFLRQNHGVLYRPGSWKGEGTLADLHQGTGHHEVDSSKNSMTSVKAVEMAGHGGG